MFLERFQFQISCYLSYTFYHLSQILKTNISIFKILNSFSYGNIVGIQINEKLCPSSNRHVAWFIPFRTDMSVR